MNYTQCLDSLASLEAFRDRFPIDVSQALVPIATEATSRERIERIAEIAARAIEELQARQTEESEPRAPPAGGPARAARPPTRHET